jgi:hypothetical protein
MSNWLDLTIRAHQHLQLPHERSRLGSFRLLQLIEACEGSNTESWEILTREVSCGAADTLTTIVRTWREDLDHPDVEAMEDQGYETGSPEFNAEFKRRLPSQPTITERLVQVPRQPVEHQVARISSLVLPTVPHDNITPPAVISFELTVGNWWSGVTYRWKGEGLSDGNLSTR